MNTVIAVLCIIGVAFVSSAPVENEEASKAVSVAQEGLQERAAEAPEEIAEVEDRAAENVDGAELAERAAEIPQEMAENVAGQEVNERAAEIPQEIAEKANKDRALGFISGIQERGLVPSVRDVLNAIESKYFTEDGRALLKSVLPLA